MGRNAILLSIRPSSHRNLSLLGGFLVFVLFCETGNCKMRNRVTDEKLSLPLRWSLTQETVSTLIILRNKRVVFPLLPTSGQEMPPCRFLFCNQVTQGCTRAKLKMLGIMSGLTSRWRFWVRIKLIKTLFFFLASNYLSNFICISLLPRETL